MVKEAAEHSGGWPARREILRAAALESTAHGLGRTVGDRHWAVRLVWLAAFLVVVGLLLNQLVEAVRKLRLMPVSTSVEPNADQFVFPDIHICSYPMVSASYSANMGPAELNYTEQQMDKIARLMQLANITGGELSRLTAQAFVGTVPYSFLSRNFGMRMEQTFIGASVMPVTVNLRLGVDIVDLRHYKYLNCFTIRLNGSTMQSLLSNVMGYLDLALYADASYNQTLRLSNGTIDARGLSFVNYEFLIGSGFRIYFTQRGKYPDDYSTSVAVSPGFHNYISLSMSRTTLAIEKSQCISDQPDALILDQATEQSVGYTYSLGTCYANSLSKVYERIGCYIPGYAPTPYIYKDLPGCNNLTRLLASYYNSSSGVNMGSIQTMQKIYNGSVAKDMVTFVDSMQLDCQYSKPCDDYAYQPTVTSVLFPLKQGLRTELTNIFKTLTEQRRASYSVPGRDWMVGLFDAAYPNGTTDSAAEAALITAAVENIVRVQIQTGELSSTRLNQGISYKLDDLTAGVGGLMGLFMGGSVLTLLELVELCLCLVWGRKLTAAASSVKPESTQEMGKTVF